MPYSISCITGYVIEGGWTDCCIKLVSRLLLNDVGESVTGYKCWWFFHSGPFDIDTWYDLGENSSTIPCTCIPGIQTLSPEPEVSTHMLYTIHQSSSVSLSHGHLLWAKRGVIWQTGLKKLKTLILHIVVHILRTHEELCRALPFCSAVHQYTIIPKKGFSTIISSPLIILTSLSTSPLPCG